MTRSISIEKDKVYFVYVDSMRAEEGFKRLRHLNPHICSRDGYLNAVVVDLRYVKPMGEA